MQTDCRNNLCPAQHLQRRCTTGCSAERVFWELPADHLVRDQQVHLPHPLFSTGNPAAFQAGKPPAK